VVRYHSHSHTWLEIFRAYQAMWGAKSLMEDEAGRSRNLKLQCIYLMLSAYGNEQNEQMHGLAKIPQLAELPMYKELVRLFTTKEVFAFGEVKAALQTELEKLGTFDAKEVELMLSTFHKRVTEHNIEVIAKYYARITMKRLGEHLELPLALMEEQLCEMVTKKQVYARIDRPRGIVTFQRPKTANALLNDWSSDIGTLLTKLEGACHQGATDRAKTDDRDLAAHDVRRGGPANLAAKGPHDCMSTSTMTGPVIARASRRTLSV
jgi:26S proteasome regulatory subunit N5